MDAWLYPHVAEKLEELIVKHEIRTVLEIGTCYGCSAIWFAQRVERVTCIDLWGDILEHGLYRIYEQFIANAVAAGLYEGDQLYWMVANSHDALPVASSYDLVYLDGDHTYEGVKQDIDMYGPLASKVLCGDDYDVELPSVAGVIRAVDECVPERKTHGRFWYIEK